MIGQFMQYFVYCSIDVGKIWSYFFCCVVGLKLCSGDGIGIWEFEFVVVKDGQFVCMYFDEIEMGLLQVLKIISSVDGFIWIVLCLLVGGVLLSDWLGMVVISCLVDGSYLLSYEFCSIVGLDCCVYLKCLVDGLDWGLFIDRGFELKMVDGCWFCYVLIYVVLLVSNCIVLVGQIFVNSVGSVDMVGNGGIVFISSMVDVSGIWMVMVVFVKLQNLLIVINWCQNYFLLLLFMVDGKQLLMLVSDFEMVNGVQVCCMCFVWGVLLF